MKYIENPNEYQGAGPEKSIYLVGGLDFCHNWQKDLVDKLAVSELAIVNSRKEFCDFVTTKSQKEQRIIWSFNHLLRVDAIVFWFSRPCVHPMTCLELGTWITRPKKLFIGIEPGHCLEQGVVTQTRLHKPFQMFHNNLEDLAEEILQWTHLGAVPNEDK